MLYYEIEMPVNRVVKYDVLGFAIWGKGVRVKVKKRQTNNEMTVKVGIQSLYYMYIDTHDRLEQSRIFRESITYYIL